MARSAQRTAHFYLKLKPEEILEYYQGLKKFVRVRTYEGYSIQFRAEHLRAWVGRHGIHGEFEISFDQHNRFAGLVMYRDLSGAQEIARGGGARSGASAGSPPPGPNQRPRGFSKSI